MGLLLTVEATVETSPGLCPKSKSSEQTLSSKSFLWKLARKSLSDVLISCSRLRDGLDEEHRLMNRLGDQPLRCLQLRFEVPSRRHVRTSAE